MTSPCCQVQEYCFTHRAHVGNRHSRSVHLQSVHATPEQSMHFMHHSLNFCDSKKLRAPLYLVCTTSALAPFVRFCLIHFTEFSARSWRWDGSAPLSQPSVVFVGGGVDEGLGEGVGVDADSKKHAKLGETIQNSHSLN